MIPRLSELLASARVVRLELKAPFRGVTYRELLLFEGPSGWGEFGPFLDHPDEHAAHWLAAAIEQAYGEWPQLQRTEIAVNAILPELPPPAAAEWARAAVASGATAIKLKVASDPIQIDIARVRAVRAVAEGAAIRIDANAHWSLDHALEFLPLLDRAAGGLEFVEQPCASLQDCAALRRRVDVRIAVDEGLRLAAQPADAIADVRAAADILMLKAIPLGGVLPALRLAELAGLPAVVSGSLDSSVGLAAGLHLAGALPNLEIACGLGTGQLLEQDLVAASLLPQAGKLRVQRLAPEPELLAAAAARVSAERQHFWRERLARCYAHLESA